MRPFAILLACLAVSPAAVADEATILPVFLLGGGGNAHGLPGETPLHAMPPGSHPADKDGGVRFHDGSGWTPLGSANRGPEVAFARLLWDAGMRGFGIVKATTTGGGNSLWHKGSGDDSAYQALITTATAAAATPPNGIGTIAFRALLYVQGEQNDEAEAEVAGTRFAELLENLKADLADAENLQGIIGGIGGGGATRDTTRSRHATLAASRADIGLARQAGLATHNEDGLGIH